MYIVIPGWAHQAADLINSIINSVGGEVYLVGGFVRDLLSRRQSKDLDFCTDIEPETLVKLLNERGLNIWKAGERFGTVGTSVDGTKIEITTYRTEKYSPGSRHPEVAFGKDLLEDLSRRDFTINAMAAEIDTGMVIDPFQGAEDLRKGVIRSPGNPKDRMREDPLRMLRAVRFASRYGFAIEDELRAVIRDAASSLSDISEERKREELEAILVSERTDYGLRTLVLAGLMDQLLPEIAALSGVEQNNPYHRMDVLEHTLMTVSLVKPSPLLRRAALFHDIGKSLCMSQEGENASFHSHEVIGEHLSRNAMNRLRYSNADIAKTTHLVRHHMRPHQYTERFSDKAMRRIFRKCTLISNQGNVLVSFQDIADLARADIAAGSLDKIADRLASLNELVARETTFNEKTPVESITSPLNGYDLMKLTGRGPGRWIKDVKEYLEELVLTGELNQKDSKTAKDRALEFIG